MGGLLLDFAGEGEAFRLKGFSLQICLLCERPGPEASGLGVVEGRGGEAAAPLVSKLRLV